MRRHSTFRSGNPTLTSKVFENLERPKNGPLVRDDVMTIQGTVDKTGISLALLIFAGYFAYVQNGLFLERALATIVFHVVSPVGKPYTS